MSDDAGHRQQRALRRRNIALAVVLAGLAVGFYVAFFVVVSSH